jgi:putative ABC transport system permease protein
VFLTASPVLKVTLRGLRAHKVRFLATALAVLLGVAFMAGTQVFTDTFSRSFDQIFVNVDKGIDAVVRSKVVVKTNFGDQRSRVDESLVTTLGQVHGVAEAAGVVSGNIRILDRSGKAMGDANTGPPTLGLNWITDPELNQWHIVDGHPPTDANQVVLDKASAEAAHYRVGDQVGLIVGQGTAKSFTLAGIAKFGQLDNYSGASAALLDTPTAQALIAQPATFDYVAIAAEPGVSQSALVANIDAAGLPAQTQAITGAAFTKENQDIFEQAISTFKTVLVAFALVSLFVGAFIIYNTFSIIVAQRTREIALLRAIGASRRQVLGSIFGEALAVGVVASVLGVVAGVGLAVGLHALLARAGLSLPSTPPVISATTVISSIVVGVGVTLVAALFPARRAASVAPIAAMRRVAIDVSNRSRVRLLAGLVLVAAGLAELYQGLFTGTGSRLPHVGLGAFAIFVGVAVLGPSFAGVASRTLGWPLAALGITGRLARENAVRNPKRTSATASALMIGVGLIVFFAVAGQSIKASASAAIDKTVTGDFVIDSQSFGNGGLNPLLTRQVQALPQVQTATGIRFGLAKIDHSGTVVLAVDPTTFTQIVKLPVVAGSFDRLGVDGVAIPESLATDKHWTIGSVVPATFTLTGSRPLTVAVIYQATLPGQGRYLMSLAGFDANFPLNEQVDNQIYVKLKPGADGEAARVEMTRLAQPYPTAKVQDLQTFKKAQLAQIDQLLTIVTLLLALSLLIALIGVVNTLLLSVYERTREIGLLRAVGETRRQLRRSVSEESVIITLLGTFLGLVIGIGFAWALVRALADQHLNDFSIPVGQLVEFVIIAAVVGVVAALYPAFRAARLNVLEAIATD